MRRLVIAASAGFAALLLGLALQTSASVAAPKPIPPGGSAADEYTEGVPGPGGKVAIGDIGSGDPGSKPKGAYRELAESGGPGAAAAAAALAATDPGAGGGKGSKSGAKSGGGSVTDLIEDGSGSTVVEGVSSAVLGGGGEGMGIGLPLIMGLFALAAVGFVLVRARANRG